LDGVRLVVIFDCAEATCSEIWMMEQVHVRSKPEREVHFVPPLLARWSLRRDDFTPVCDALLTRSSVHVSVRRGTRPHCRTRTTGGPRRALFAAESGDLLGGGARDDGLGAGPWSLGAPEPVLTLRVTTGTEPQRFLRSVSTWTRYVLFSGDMFPSAPAEVRDSESRLDLEFMATEPRTVLERISVSVSRPADGNDTQLVVSVAHQKLRDGTTLRPFSAPSWRSIVRKLTTHLQIQHGGANVEVEYSAPYIRLGRTRRRVGSTAADPALLAVVIPEGDVTDLSRLVLGLQDWGMGLQFSSEGSWISLRPAPAFSVLPLDSGVEFVFRRGIKPAQTSKLEVTAELKSEGIHVVARPSGPHMGGPKSMSKRLRLYLERKYPGMRPL